MLRKKISKVIAVAALLVVSVLAHAQDGAYSGYTPYSIFGVGQILNQGSAYNKTMGGVGVATRDRRHINYLNPAAITARDSLAFMADFSLQESNTIFRQGDKFSANNLFNINDIVISFPLESHSAMAVGIVPYSATGYSYGAILKDPSIIGYTGDSGYTAVGQGSMYKLFAQAAVTFWKRLSIGVEGIYYFGNISKEYNQFFTSKGYGSIDSGFNFTMNAQSAKFGIQYEQPFGGGKALTIGATYTLGANLKGYVNDYCFATGTAQTDTLRSNIDTLAYRSDKVRLASELGVGISFRSGEKWRAEVNYLRSDWSASNMDRARGFAVSGSSVFSATTSESIRAGFEIVPNRNDIRYYYKRIAYRAGGYYEKANYLLDGYAVNAYGITLGATLPIFRAHNGLTLGMDIGRRGSVANNLVRETYVNFSVGFNMFDIWFRKPTYE